MALLYLSFTLRKTKLWGRPAIIMLEPSSRCNLKCPMCPRQLFPSNRSQGDMRLEDFKKIISQLSPAAFILALWNYGEPLLNEDIFKMITFAKAKDMGVILSTNATLLGEAGKIDSLIDSGLDYLIISLDGATKQTYERYRASAKFEDTIDNIKKLITRKKQRAKINPLINLQFLVMKENEHELEEINNLSRALDADRLSLKNVYYVKYRQDEFLPRNKKYICRYYSRPDSKKCRRPFISTLINSNGDVLPCCSDVKFENVFGNIFLEQDFGAIWNGKGYQEFRKAMLNNIADIGICQNCAGKSFSDQSFTTTHRK